MSAQNISDKVPKYGPAAPPVGILWSALRAAGEKVELEFLTGISGAAFRTCFDENGSDETLWQEGARAADNALPILGYELRSLCGCAGKKLSSTDREKCLTELHVAIDQGTPVIATGSFGWSLLLGYDKPQRQVWLRQVSPWNAVHDMSRCPPWEAGLEQEERWEQEDRLVGELERGMKVGVLQKRGKPLPKRGLVVNALRHAVLHAKEKPRGTKHLGLGALEFFRHRLQKEAEDLKWDPQVSRASLPMQVIFLAVSRAAAVGFLKHGAAEFDRDKKALLEKCSAIYAESAREWLALQTVLPNPQAYYESRGSAKNDPELLRHMAESLGKVLEIERRAYTELEGAV